MLFCLRAALLLARLLFVFLGQMSRQKPPPSLLRPTICGPWWHFSREAKRTATILRGGPKERRSSSPQAAALQVELLGGQLREQAMELEKEPSALVASLGLETIRVREKEKRAKPRQDRENQSTA